MKRINVLLALTISSFILFSCGDKKKDANATTEAAVATEAAVTEAPVIKEDATNILISGTDGMQFDKNEIRIPKGEKITLTLKHTGSMDKSLMGHNVVILKKGMDIAEFATKAMDAKDTEYIPADEKDNVIAHTKMIGGGEYDTIEFTIEEAGEYDFLCSFPGHYAMMKGKVIVE